MPDCRSCGRYVADLAMWLAWRGYGRTCARREGIRPVRPRPADAGPGQLELDLEGTVSTRVQSEVADGVRCAVCEEPFATDARTVYIHEQGVMVHEGCWS